MTGERLRVLIAAALSIALLLVVTLTMPWFVVKAMGTAMTIDLHEVKACQHGACVSFALAKAPGSFPWLGNVTFYGVLALTAVVAYQAGCRLLVDRANPLVTRIASTAVAILVATVFGFAIVTGPDTGTAEMGSIVRTWAWLLEILGLVGAAASLYFSAESPLDLPVARATFPPAIEKPTTGPLAGTERPSEKPITGGSRPLHPSMPIPALVKGKLRYCVMSGDVTRGGIDARREDGSTVLVMWRDVVGVVARRLPPALLGATFVDIVSSAGQTLRVLPWSRLTGALIEPTTLPADEAERARAVITLVTAQCPEAPLDPATRTFVEGTGAAAQLPDVETLAVHDARLA